MTEYLAFKQALTNLGMNPKKAKAFLNDKRMTHAEKQILLALLILRDQENDEAMKILNGLVTNHPMVESVRLFGLAIAANNKTLFPEAIAQINRALQNWGFENFESYKEVILNALFCIHFNLRDIHGMEATLEKLERIPGEQISFHHCLFLYQVTTGKNENMEKLIKDMELRIPKMKEHQVLGHYFALFDHYVAEKNFKKVRAILERIKNVKKFKNTSVTKFNRALVDFIENNDPIFLNPSDLSDSPYIELQLRLILNLKTGDVNNAKFIWSSLHELNPVQFKEPFKLEGPPTLLGLCLEKLIKKDVGELPKEVGSGKLLESKVLSLLIQSEFPISKEDLHERIWGHFPEDKNELNKLSKLIQRAKEKYNVEVKYQKGSYSLVKKNKQSA
jgi:tetratricopeptide (TPR) repeat protein